jgi:DNA ligase-1
MGSRDRVAALVAHFGSVPPEDAAWALHCLLGKQRRRLITARRLRQIALEATALPDWLFEASYAQVGDSAETIALLVGGRLDPAERTASRPAWWSGGRSSDRPRRAPARRAASRG